MKVQLQGFWRKKEEKILQNVQTAKVRNTLSKVVGGKAITNDDIVAKIKRSHGRPEVRKGKEKVN